MQTRKRGRTSRTDRRGQKKKRFFSLFPFRQENNTPCVHSGNIMITPLRINAYSTWTRTRTIFKLCYNLGRFSHRYPAIYPSLPQIISYLPQFMRVIGLTVKPKLPTHSQCARSISRHSRSFRQTPKPRTRILRTTSTNRLSHRPIGFPRPIDLSRASFRARECTCIHRSHCQSFQWIQESHQFPGTLAEPGTLQGEGEAP